MATLYVAMGSNIEPEENIVAAVRHLKKQVEVIAVSTIYRTKPLTRPDQADFRNGVVALQTRTPVERDALTRDLLKPIETALGRVRTADKHAARTIDLDLSVYCEAGRVTWLDPEVLQRNFIAIPLAELAALLPLPDGRRTADVAQALGREGLVPDEALTRRVKELVEHE